jgi:SH3 domain-containing YSC84-like protein 1
VIVERQDANAQAYQSDVTVKQLLGGSIEPPPWASPLLKTIEACTGMPGGRKWIDDERGDSKYVFGGMASPGSELPPSLRKQKRKSSYPPPSWGAQKSSGSYFSDYDDSVSVAIPSGKPSDSGAHDWTDNFSASKFETQFDSDFSNTQIQTSRTKQGFSKPVAVDTLVDLSEPPITQMHSRSASITAAQTSIPPSFPVAGTSVIRASPLSLKTSSSLPGNGISIQGGSMPVPSSTTGSGQRAPLPSGAIARAVALYNFQAMEVSTLPSNKLNGVEPTDSLGISRSTKVIS